MKTNVMKIMVTGSLRALTHFMGGMIYVVFVMGMDFLADLKLKGG